MVKAIIPFILFFSLILSVPVVRAQNVQSQSAKFNWLLRTIDVNYADSVNIKELTEAAMVKLLSELDPHSVYISEKEVDEMNQPLQGSFDGIGISFNILHDTLIVVQTIPGGPSEKVGLMAGDRILSVDDELIAGKGITSQDVFKRLRGEKGTLVKVKILRKGEKELLDFDIIRDKIPIFSLDASYMIDSKTGYIKLSRFSATTTEEFIEALKKLQLNPSFENLILDLRGNGGGFLKSAYEVVDQFLGAGKLVVYTQGIKSERKDYISTNQGLFEKGRLVVLIDVGSASASEIVSGAVQDWDRGVIVGRRSFGKGLVQQPFSYIDGSMIRLTTAHYYTPSGRCIQKPYDDGVEEYQNDYSERYKRGELFSKDSIAVNQSLKYKTLVNHRDVFGGGGVIPDVFIPIDTTTNYKYYNQLVRKNVVYQFVVDYVDSHRKEMMNDYPDFATFKKKFNVSDQMLDALWNEGVKKDIAKDEESINLIDQYARRHVKSLVARDLWNSSEFFEIYNEGEEEILKALSVINNQAEYNAILKGEK
ncbi:MAG TPA: S41 family peptidase [Prolixibacteraceae bacterium]|nr:S41 family peptidase [Prolixibacteraceae bacterium]